MLALSTGAAIAFTLAILALVAFAVALSRAARGARLRRDAPDIPAAMQPGPPDAELERSRLERLQGWGVALVIFFVVWIPLVWLKEPTENLTQERALKTDSIARGHDITQLISESNPSGYGCVRCHGDQLTGGLNLFNNAVVHTPNLTTVCGGPNTGHAAIHNLQDVYKTIEEGRAGTDMPSWSVRYAGSMDDQQIQDVVTYLLSIQDPKLVPFKYNVCINTSAKGYLPPT